MATKKKAAKKAKHKPRTPAPGWKAKAPNGSALAITDVKKDGDFSVTLNAKAYKNLANGKAVTLVTPIDRLTVLNKKESTRITIPKGFRALVFKPGTPVSFERIQELVDNRILPPVYDTRPKTESPRPTLTDIASDFCRKISEEHSIADQNRIILELVSTMRSRRAVHANRAESDLREVTANRDKKLRDLEALERILRGDYDKLDLAGGE